MNEKQQQIKSNSIYLFGTLVSQKLYLKNEILEK